ncbi:MAG: Asp-tRNA(Asn)/Glu-tRNA(Gln) amidotransferase subunit GatC [Anaerolineales bacterium]|nr:Asp-tRNA(Asn)/Glu-tRNA(Gln) amidotransferase subunit GatC [Anaerolineales bacterium]
MPLSIEEVQHIAALARLELSEAELARYRGQLSAILDHVAKLQELDTADIPPTASVIEGQSPLRDDIVLPSLETGRLLENSKHTGQDQFKIPPVFE